MTTAQKKIAQAVLAIVGAVAAVALTTGAQLQKLEGKEDRASHDADVRFLTSSIQAEANARALQQVRDSAWRAVILDRVTDLACVQNPNRNYCR
jgi:hypothetical protein